MVERDVFQRYLDAGIAFTNLTRAKAEDLVDELIQGGELQGSDAKARVEELLERSRRGRATFVEQVRREVGHQLDALGISSLEDLAHQVADLLNRTADTGRRRTGARPATRTSGTKKAAPKKAAPKKAGTKKAGAKRVGTKKAGAKKSTAAGTTGKTTKAAVKKKSATKRAAASTSGSKKSGSRTAASRTSTPTKRARSSAGSDRGSV